MSGNKYKTIKKLKKKLKKLAKRIDSVQKQLVMLQTTDRRDNDSEEVVIGEAHFTEAEMEQALEATEDAEEFDDMLEKTKR